MAKGSRSQFKQERNEKNRETRPHATVKFVRLSDTKARIVLEQIKGKDVGAALALLTYSPRYAATVIKKLLLSAVANAENNLNIDAKDLYVAEVFANQGPTLKRIRPRAKGMAYRINKRTSHLSLILNKRRHINGAES
ncbi:MAG: 50S ribosomal protein L22 [Clostridiales bacterium]|jgi:large subunit ribosomal protein L22|nr:50S ribosomal protein L22 [Clostridiales bacterium]